MNRKKKHAFILLISTMLLISSIDLLDRYLGDSPLIPLVAFVGTMLIAIGVVKYIVELRKGN